MPLLRILVVGPGLMGSQIACEYAIHGHEVLCVSRSPTGAEERVRRALAMVVELSVVSGGAAAGAADRISFSDRLEDGRAVDLVVESVPEDLELKAEVLGAGARLFPDAVLASNTSSLSISELGEAVG